METEIKIKTDIYFLKEQVSKDGLAFMRAFLEQDHIIHCFNPVFEISEDHKYNGWKFTRTFNGDKKHIGMFIDFDQLKEFVNKYGNQLLTHPNSVFISHLDEEKSTDSNTSEIK